MADNRTPGEAAGDSLLDEYLDRVGWSAERWTLTGEDRQVYGHNLVGALDAYLSLIAPDTHRRYTDIGDMKPDVANQEVDLYHLSGVESDRTAKQQPSQFLEQMLRLRNQTKLLFDHYDEVKCSVETGIPLYRGAQGFRGVQKDTDTVEEQLAELRDAYASWAHDVDATDVLPLPEKDSVASDADTYQQLANAEKELFWQQVHETLRSEEEPPHPEEIDWPAELAQQARHLDYLRKADTIDPVTPARVDADIGEGLHFEELPGHDQPVGMLKEGEWFAIQVSNFSTPSHDRFLHYVIEGYQAKTEDGSRFSIFNGIPPIKENDSDYSLSEEFKGVVKDAIGFPPENLYTIWTALDEKYDLNQGERIQPLSVELRKVGPLYTAGNRPVATDTLLQDAVDGRVDGLSGIVDETAYDNIFDVKDAFREELLDQDPRRYAGLQIGQFLADNPEEFVFVVETEGYRPEETDDTKPGHEIVLASSDAESLAGYMPEEFDGETTDVLSWVIDVPNAKPVPETFRMEGGTQ